ncbi:MAG: PIG-L family deacetylase [Anaerolineae bacterium]|nr:PIG-L family deacetylase [Anaerolineae bacterium]
MTWIYLSPHLDDIALSLGGLLWQQSQAGERVSVWTICAGNAPAGPLSSFAQSLHVRWGVGREATATRREEDIESCRILEAAYQHFSLPDCIYRRSPRTGEPLYASEEAIFGEVHPDEVTLVEQLTQMMKTALPADASVIVPWGLGGHVDHRLTQAAAQRLNLPLRYYADYPYVLDIPAWDVGDLTPRQYPVSKAALAKWQSAVAAHQSQISTFWASRDEMYAAIQFYAEKRAGVTLWV